MKVPDEPWRLVCSPDQFESSLRADKEFAFLVTVARISSAIKFGAAAKSGSGQSASNARSRQNFQAFLYLAGLVHEALELQRKHEHEWGGLSAWSDIFAVFDDSALDMETRELVGRIRNRTAFHFDPTIAARVLPRLPAAEYALLSADGKKRMDTTSELADIVTMVFLFGSPADPDAILARFANFFAKLRQLVDDFSLACDSALLARARARGLRVQLGKNF